MCLVHKYKSKGFISVSLERYVSKYVNRFEQYLVWNKCILYINIFFTWVQWLEDEYLDEYLEVTLYCKSN